MIPLLLAANPVPVGSYVPYVPPANSPLAGESMFLQSLSAVETFDPVARAVDLARDLPRSWSGTYQAFSGAAPLSVVLRFDSATPMGQMVDVRGQITVGSTTTAVQGNLNAKSDQLDLLLLCRCADAELEGGGQFLGLQGVNLSGWVAPRLTNPGGFLNLVPVASSRIGTPTPLGVRGLW